MASEVKTNKVSAASGATVTLGNSGDTVSLGSGATASGFLPSSISTSGDDFQFNSGYGSVATAYGCRAWVNFVGTGTVTINNSANVSSVTDVAAGRYFVNFTNSLPDANFSAVVSGENTTLSGNWGIVGIDRSSTITTSGFGIIYYLQSGTQNDNELVMAGVFR
jgi:hypothetical protein